MKKNILNNYLVQECSEEELQQMYGIKSQAGDAFLCLQEAVRSGIIADSPEVIKSQDDYRLALQLYNQVLDLLPERTRLVSGTALLSYYIVVISHLADLYSMAGENAFAIHYNNIQLSFPSVLIDSGGVQTDANIRFNLGTNYSEMAGNMNNTLDRSQRTHFFQMALDHLSYSIIEYRRLIQHYRSIVESQGAPKKQLDYAQFLQDHYTGEALTGAEEFDSALMAYAFYGAGQAQSSTEICHFESGSRVQKKWLNTLAYRVSAAELKASYQSMNNLAVGPMAERHRVLSTSVESSSSAKRNLKLSASDNISSTDSKEGRDDVSEYSLFSNSKDMYSQKRAKSESPLLEEPQLPQEEIAHNVTKIDQVQFWFSVQDVSLEKNQDTVLKRDGSPVDTTDDESLQKKSKN